MHTEDRFTGTVWGGFWWERLTGQRLQNALCLEQYGYKVFSQNDEDGIIAEIFRRIECEHKVFVEFGVENGLESNCHLLLHKGWSGLWIEGNRESYAQMQEKFRPLIRQGTLKAVNAFITKENINDLIDSAGIAGEIGLLSIDVDGNDYDIWEAVDVVDPAVVVIEYNGKFPPDVEWKMAYDRNHMWNGTDWHGASLKALQLLGEKKGYQLVGTGLNGANAFFVKRTLADGRFYEPATAEALYNPLRLELVHKNGHPADVCLCGQSSNRGIFDYKEAETAAVCYGFHSQECNSAGDRYAWSSQRECALLFNGEKFRGGDTIVVPYFSGIRQGEMQVLFDGVQKAEACPVKQEGMIEISLTQQEREQLDAGGHLLVIRTSKMFVPYEEGINEDRRSLGIAVRLDRIAIKDAKKNTVQKG